MNNRKSTPLMNENLNLDIDMKGISHFARYDEGLKDFLKKFFVGSVVIVAPSEFFEMYSKTEGSNDSITLPAISIYPTNYSLNTEVNSFPNYQLGTMIEDRIKVVNEDTNEVEGSSVLLSKMTRTLTYDIDYTISVWGINRNDTLQLLQEILFPLYQHGEYLVKYFNNVYSIPYKIDNGIVDQSSIGLNQIAGTLYRYDISLHITAPIFDSKNYYNTIDTNLKINTELGNEKIN